MVEQKKSNIDASEAKKKKETVELIGAYRWQHCGILLNNIH